MQMNDIAARVAKMERYYDAVSRAVKAETALSVVDDDISTMLDSFINYYENGQWLADYQADERGELPADLKRGVLSQDGLYNLLDEIKEIAVSRKTAQALPKENLLFYEAYESFYSMAECSEAFRDFCNEAYGADFSQDGFSDAAQIERIFSAAHLDEHSRILDIGCGNGKMLRYLQQRTGAYICGFDYSENAVSSARSMALEKADFRCAVIGEAEYPEESFDLITSLDTVYFAKDMSAFMAQVKRWLKADGKVFIAYQEGDVMPRIAGSKETVIAQALRANDLRYTVEDITLEAYEMLRRKRAAAEKFRQRFIDEEREWLYELLIGQTEYAAVSFEEFRKNNARYIFIAEK